MMLVVLRAWRVASTSGRRPTFFVGRGRFCSGTMRDSHQPDAQARIGKYASLARRVGDKRRNVERVQGKDS